ncbi:MAG TPA: alpha/beta hydrolase [Bradyrhizobium sp.]|nr:alpha/beta hydrolase [Bradyrhizobium sp.]
MRRCPNIRRRTFSHLLRLLLLAPLALASLSAAGAAEFYAEELRIPMAAASPQGLEALLVRPAASGRYPLALINHGTPRDSAGRATMTARSYYPIALEFARRGFAALVVMRRGYGSSPGGFADSLGPCPSAAYLPASAAAVADLRAAIDAMRTREDVGLRGMIAVGHSAGGLATIALAAQPPQGLAAAINFAGGRGSYSPGKICNENGLVQAFAEFGKTSRIPMLWVYAENDMFFAPSLAHRLYDAFRAGGGSAAFIDAPPYGEDGHYLFSADGRPQWTPLVDVFLRDHGLETRTILSEPDIPAPPQLSSTAKDDFAQYLGKGPHKAFAVSSKGAFGWRSGKPSAAEARDAALAACSRWAQDCSLYAVDDRLVRE